MNYDVIWSDGAKQKMEASFQRERSPERLAWVRSMIYEIINRDISEYPRDAAARPGEHATGIARVGGLRIHYDIEFDRELGVGTRGVYLWRSNF